MSDAKNVLLVEGVNDKAFFERLCKAHKLNVKIQVSNPIDHGGFNSKQGVINTLDRLLPLLEDDDYVTKKVAIILDADITGENRGGFKETIAQVKEKASKYDYQETHKYLNNGVEVPHKDKGMNALGVWIMPDNKSDGTIENWIKAKILDSEKPLFDHACHVIKSLPNVKFSESSIVKAEIATWLAWQNQPGRTIGYALKEGEELLDVNHESFKALIEWLKVFFSD